MLYYFLFLLNFTSDGSIVLFTPLHLPELLHRFRFLQRCDQFLFIEISYCAIHKTFNSILRNSVNHKSLYYNNNISLKGPFSRQSTFTLTLLLFYLSEFTASICNRDVFLHLLEQINGVLLPPLLLGDVNQ